jgi:hypothetical protein
VRLLAAVRRAGRVVIETGTGITMSASANVAQWLAWALMIATGSMNRPGGIWFHPGFHRRLDASELPIVPPDVLFGPGPASRPEARSLRSLDVLATVEIIGSQTTALSTHVLPTKDHPGAAGRAAGRRIRPRGGAECPGPHPPA